MTKFRGFQKYAYKKQKPGYYLHDFLNTKNPLVLFGNKKFVLGIVGLSLIIGGVVLAQGPLFHNGSPGLVLVEGSRDVYTEPFSNDPFTTLWSGGIDTGNLNGYDNSNKGTCTGNNFVSFFSESGTPTILMNSSSNAINNMALFAVSQSRIDLSLGSAKELSFEEAFMFKNGITSNTGASWGWYLTTNSTSPRCDEPNGNYGYTPMADPNVALAVKNVVLSGTTIQTTVFLQRQPHQSITSEDTGTCSGGSSCFLQSNQVMSNVGNTIQINDLILNFTGHTSTGGNNGASLLCAGTTGATKACTIGGFGDTIIADGMDANSKITSTAIFPWINLATPYYMGFWATGVGSVANGNHSIEWSQVATGLFANNWISYFVPVPTAATPATPDTGGFFGPIIRALISIGVFILANIISFGNYLGGLMGPVWAFLGGLAATVLNGLSSIIISLINALGSLIGDPNLGNQLVSVFTQIGSYVTGLFVAIGNIVSNLITFIENSMTFLFDSVNGLLTYWIGTVLFGILGVLVSISGFIVTVLKVFQVGFPFVVLFDLLWLLMESYDNGVEGAMKWWAPHEILVVNVGKLMFILVETLSTFVYQTIVEIEGGAADIKPEIAGFSP